MSTKRQEIIAVAASLIRSKGYESTKLSDILEAANIGKGQFYHYFSSKHDLGSAVIDQYYYDWNQQCVVNILDTDKDPETKFNEMLEWVVNKHMANQMKSGCVFGNLAIEISEHDEIFRRKVKAVFEMWVEKLKPVLIGMVKTPVYVEPTEVERLAQGIVATLEGGILLMKSKQDIEVLKNVVDLARRMVDNFVKDHTVEKKR